MISILLVDDDPFIRESLKLILDLNPDLHVAATCCHGDEALEWMSRGEHVDIVLMDIRMPVCDGVEGTRKIKLSFPHVHVLILTTFDDDEYIIQALQNGAGGYMLKNISPDRIIEGIKTVNQGNLLVHPSIAKKLTGFLQPKPQSNQQPKQSLDGYGLTKAEEEIVQKIAEGKSNKEIAAEMFLSEGTIKNYITEILSKLELRDRTQIAILYLTRK